MTIPYHKAVFEKWLNIYKRSISAYLVLKALEKQSLTVKQLKDFMQRFGLELDSNSVYRALRRLNAMDLIDFKTEQPPGTGLKRKIFYLTQDGKKVLKLMDKQIKKLR